MKGGPRPFGIEGLPILSRPYPSVTTTEGCSCPTHPRSHPARCMELLSYAEYLSDSSPSLCASSNQNKTLAEPLARIVSSDYDPRLFPRSKESKLANVSFFFLFHPRNYYKLSLCVIFSNTFDNFWKSQRAYAQWRMLYKLRYL